MRGGLHVLEQGLLVTAGVAFLISVALSPLFIPFLRKLKFGQSIRDEGPKSHQKNQGHRQWVVLSYMYL